MVHLHFSKAATIKKKGTINNVRAWVNLRIIMLSAGSHSKEYIHYTSISLKFYLHKNYSTVISGCLAIEEEDHGEQEGRSTKGSEETPFKLNLLE